METLLQPEPGLKTWAEQLTASLHAERDRVCEFLAAQQARLERAEAVLEKQLVRLEELAREPMTETGDQVVLPLPTTTIGAATKWPWTTCAI